MNNKHATRENYYLIKASHKRSQPTQQQQVGGEAAAAARNRNCSKQKESQANGGSSSLHKRKPTYTDGFRKLSVRFLTQATYQISWSSRYREQSTPFILLSRLKSAVRQPRELSLIHI